MPNTPTLARWAILLAASTVLLGCVVAPVESSATYRHDTVVYTRYGYPPPLRVEHRPRAPGPDYVWEQGSWVWSGQRYQWHGGSWVLSLPLPRPPVLIVRPPRPPAHVAPPPPHYRPPAQTAPRPPHSEGRPLPPPRPHQPAQRPHRPKPSPEHAQRPRPHQPGANRPQTLPEYPHRRPGAMPAHPGR